MNTSIILATVLCLLCTILTEGVHDNLAKQTFILPLRSEGNVVASRCPLTLGVSVNAQQQHTCRYRNLQRRCSSGDRGQGILLSPVSLSSWFGVSPWDCSRCAPVSLWLGALACNLSTANYDREAILSVFILQTARRPGTRFQGIFVTHTISQINTKSLQSWRVCQSEVSPCTCLPCQSTGSTREEAAAISKNCSAPTQLSRN